MGTWGARFRGHAMEAETSRMRNKLGRVGDGGGPGLFQEEGIR
jgi:hypothetical protein